MSVKVTARQRDVLGVVSANGPVTARDVGEYHLPIGVSSARASLDALERKGLVSAVYSGQGVNLWARNYVITDQGTEALGEIEEETIAPS